jgi:hypothetical protein
MRVSRGLRFLLVAMLAGAACGRTGGGRVGARDSGTSVSEPGPEPDLPADGSSAFGDAWADARAIGLDGGAGQDDVILDWDTGPDQAASGWYDASADATVAGEDAGPDGISTQPEVALDGAGQEAAGPFACTQGTPFGGLPLMNGGDSQDFLALGDLDGDGRLDIVTGSRDRAWDTVSVLLGQGRGSFSAKTDYYAGFQLTSLALGDVDGDGSLDIVTTSEDTNAVAVLLGRGDGTFPGRPIYGPGPALSSLALGDLNGDGRLDVVAVGTAGPTGSVVGAVSVMMGVGDGSFLSRVDYPCGDNPTEVALADVDGDGNLDVVVANSGRNTASVLRGHGDGTFAASLEFPAGADPSATFLRPAVEDLDGDGKLDVVVMPAWFAPKVLLGKGGGQLSAPLDLGLAAVGAAIGVTLGDVTGDGKLDFAVGGRDTFVVYAGRGDLTFAGGVISAVGAKVSRFGVGDLDGDGVPDLALALDRTGSDGSLAVLHGNGNGGFGPGIWHPTNTSPTSAALGDLDGDGRLDLVTVGSDSVDISLGSGDGVFAAAVEYSTGNMPVAVALGDCDGDGRQDVVTVNQNAGTVSVLRGIGAGKLAAKADWATVDDPAGLVLGDLNGDGRLDIVTFNSPVVSLGTVGVLLGIGDGRFAAGAEHAVGYGPKTAALGDVNGDGIQDLVVANAGYGATRRSASILLGRGDGTWTTATDYAIDSPWNPSSIALADLDGDGKLDMVLGISSASVAVWLGRGDGTFSAAVDYPAPGGGSVVGDVNGDGKLDIVTGSSVLFGEGDGTLPLRLDYFPSGGWFLLGDVNLDGKPDLVTGFQGGVNVLFNACR